ncbi:MarR family winged helix-turn-helix transcriptional regulator [Furfurilactobacillus milii]|uniref:MarR family transcriptional regulator n=1 Tax=Furfurilactobacillus milii TaxID=2888272 RepID=A0ABT6DD76_9LACO|nr:MarR family transcriptional regulator [Furfurilactobacillus milii]QLE65750.1 hypothetical protein LROSL2_0397 [Furfurilactobacillus rossiae]MCF6160339.1 MarR family transcriptional regulator [Furfurilactobacillus milii]MCF6162282.1 MarR family transcriptional regulator [Furfurilactobacillus milii]MCF6420105.1 MarR family transcriptional regulator [Furfurilactobacillus milii]MDF9913301.1 MarR family transcriptional regulator [Furfurilactobacillus milii]
MQNEQQLEMVITMMSEGYLASFRSIEKTLKRVAKKFGLGWSSLSILNQIASDASVTTADLIQQNHISKGAVSLQITELLNRNLIKISEDENDRRRHRLELTKRGEKVADRVHTQATEIAQRVLNEMPLTEMQRLHQNFATFAETLNSTPIK